MRCLLLEQDASDSTKWGPPFDQPLFETSKDCFAQPTENYLFSQEGFDQVPPG